MSQGIEKTYNALNLILGTIITVSILGIGGVWLYQNGTKLTKARDEWFAATVKSTPKFDFPQSPAISIDTSSMQWNYNQQLQWQKSMQESIKNMQTYQPQINTFQPSHQRFGR